MYWDTFCFGKNNYLNDYINWDILRFQKNFNNFCDCMNWDTLNFRNNKLALTVCSSRYSKVSGLYGKLFRLQTYRK